MPTIVSDPNAPPIIPNGNPADLLGGFKQRFQDAYTNPLFSIGLGLLAEDDIGSGLISGASLYNQFSSAQQEREAQRLKNEAAREELKRQTRAQRARQEVLSRVSGQDVEPGTGQGFGLLTSGEAAQRSAPGLNNSDLGLLAQAAPDLVFGGDGLLAQQFDPTDPGDRMIPIGGGTEIPASEMTVSMKNAIAASGSEPGSEAWRKKVEEFELAGKGEAVAEAELLHKQLLIREKMLETQEKEMEQERSRFNLESTLETTVEDTFTAMRRNEELRGTSLEPGFGAEGERRTLNGIIAGTREAFGADSSEYKTTSTAFDEFNRLTTNVFIDQAAQISENVGRMTNRKIDILRGTSAGTGNTADSNALALANRAEIVLQEAEANGVSVPGSKAKQLNIDVIQGEASIGSLSKEQLNMLNPEILPPNLRQQAAARWEKLN